MATYVHEYRREETRFEDEIDHQSFDKDDLAESKSADSLRSADEEEDDEVSLAISVVIFPVIGFHLRIIC